MENNQDEQFLSLIYKNIQTALGSVNNIIGKAEDTKLQKELCEQLNLYSDFLEECQQLAKEYDYELKGLNVLEKSRMWMSINMSTFCNKKPRKLSSLMILGSTMGIVDLTCLLSDYANCDKKIVAFAKKVNDQEQNFINKLKPYLLNNCKPSSPEEDINPVTPKPTTNVQTKTSDDKKPSNSKSSNKKPTKSIASKKSASNTKKPLV